MNPVNEIELKLNGFIPIKDEGNLYYQIAGKDTSKTLTIVNNFFASASGWNKYTEKIRNEFKVITYDLRNQGKSKCNSISFMFDDILDDLKLLLDELKIEKTFLLGTSTSSIICKEFAIKYPEYVSGMIIISPMFSALGSIKTRFIFKSWIECIKNSGSKGLFTYIYPLLFGDRTIESGGVIAYLALKNHFITNNSDAFLIQSLQSLLDYNFDKTELRNIKCPTLFIFGESDFFSCESSVKATSEYMENCLIKKVLFCGHLPHFEATNSVESFILDFINK